MNYDLRIAREPVPLDEAEKALILDRLEFLRELVETGAACVIFNGGGPMTTVGDRRVTHQTFSFLETEWIRVYRERMRRKTDC